jgi:hypothetical protein
LVGLSSSLADLLSTGNFIARSDVVDMTLNSFAIQIRHSKTNQFGQRILTLPYVSSSDCRLCPVRALITHLGLSILSPASPLFNFLDGHREVRFTHSLFVKKLKSSLLTCGHDASQISCHSFRRGGASMAFAVGMSSTDIKLRGDWWSSAFERYLCVSTSSTYQSARALSLGMLAFAGGV